jgi:hypothetical protein
MDRRSLRPRAAVWIVAGAAVSLALACGGLGDARPAAAAPAWASASASASASLSASARAAPRWSWPLPAPHPVVTSFEKPEEVWSPGHRGIDIGGSDAGAVVLAPDAGVVRFAGVVVDRPVLSIEHADGVLSSFEPVTATVAAGEAVERGQPVGVLEAGHCGGASCLHLGARIDGEYVSPLLLLGELRPSVLLPTRAAAGAPSGSRVGGPIALPQALGGDVRVDLRRAEARVPEELLHGAEVGAAVEEVGGGRVAERVGAGRPRARDRLQEPRHEGVDGARPESPP